MSQFPAGAPSPEAGPPSAAGPALAASGRPPSSRGRIGLLALGVATVALLVALAAVAAAVTALRRAEEAQRQAQAVAGSAEPDAPPPAPPGDAPAPADPSPTEAGDPIVSGEEQPLNPEAAFKLKYDKETLTLRVGCTSSLYIDLDDPRVGVSQNNADLIFRAKCDNEAATLKLGTDVAGATVDDGGAPSPGDCAKRIQVARIGPGIDIPVQPGVVLCMSTSEAAARAQGLTQKLVVVQVKAVGRDGTVTVEATAWDVPR